MNAKKAVFGEYIHDNSANKFLFIPDFEKGMDVFRKVCSEFLQYSFCNPDSELILVVNGLYEVGHYVYHYIFRIGLPRIFKVRYVIRRKENIFSLLKEVNYYIPSNYSNEELDVLDEAFDCGVNILSPIADNMFHGLPVDADRIQIKARIAQVLQDNLIKNFPMDEYDYFLFHQGLGETMICFYLLKEYKARFGKKILMLFFDPSREHMFNQCPYVDCTLHIDAHTFAYISIFWEEKYHIKNALGMWFAPYAPKYCWHIEDGANTMVSAVRAFLKLPVRDGLEKYSFNISSESVNIVYKKINELQIRKGNTVFLVTDAISVGDSGLGKGFWLNLIEKLEKKGHDVVVNSKDEYAEGVKVAYFKPFEAVEFVNYCGYVITVSTGILDIIGSLADSSVKVQRIMPTQLSTWKAFYASWIINLLPNMYQCGEDCASMTMRGINDYQNMLWGDFANNVKTHLYDNNENELMDNIIEGL